MTGAGDLFSSPRPVTAKPVRPLPLKGTSRGSPRRRSRPRRKTRTQGKAFPIDKSGELSDIGVANEASPQGGSDVKIIENREIM